MKEKSAIERKNVVQPAPNESFLLLSLLVNCPSTYSEFEDKIVPKAKQFFHENVVTIRYLLI